MRCLVPLKVLKRHRFVLTSSGEIIEINQEVIDNPELINEDCYANWIIKVRMSNQEELNELMDASEYQEHLE